MKQKDLKNIDKVIEFIHKYKHCGINKLNNAAIEETLEFLERLREDILDQI